MTTSLMDYQLSTGFHLESQEHFDLRACRKVAAYLCSQLVEQRLRVAASSGQASMLSRRQQKEK